MADVAREAGCSLNTVSRALNDKPDVSEPTRQRILEVARRIGYVPNAAARSLAAGRTRTIGVVVTELAVPAFASLLDAVEHVCRRAGYTVLLTSSRRDADQEEVAVRVLREHVVDGLLITPVQGHTEHLRALTEAGTPTVFMLRDVPELGCDYVGLDTYQSSRIATEHLLGLGHRRIAFLGNQLTNSQARDRLNGYLETLERAGIPRDDRLIKLAVNSTFDVAAAYEATSELIREAHPFSAVIVFSGYLAMAAMRALHEANLRVPEDVAVVAQGATEVAPYLPVALTHMLHPVDQVGVRAAQLLLERIGGLDDPAPRKVVIPPELIVQESCGTPARRLDYAI